MQIIALSLLLLMPLCSLADCGCGAKCAVYTGVAKCTRCCTATVKRSLELTPARRSHRFLLPANSNGIRIPMWLQSTHRRSSSPILKHRRHRRPPMQASWLLDQILAAVTTNSRNTS